MKKYLFLTLLTATGLCTTAFAGPDAPAVGVVNFTTCITDSKLGKQEQASFESLKKQMTSLLEDTDKQLQEINNKLNDSEFMDGLSPEGEEELKTKFRTLSEEMNRYQQQYYQVLQQANMRIIQQIAGYINQASEKVAKDKKLTMVINREACFFCAPALEVTSNVISEMDKNYEQEMKKQAAAAPAATAPAQGQTAQTPAPAAVDAKATK